ncbi:phosphoesterase [Acinetobacter phage nACB1]|nr:phosphoesterase [Acinetobacter phage nACB1]
MSELVIAIHRKELGNTDLGVIPFSFDDIDQTAYALLPRDIVDSKQEHAGTADAVGFAFPQILGYFQIMNEAGKYLAYQRKGKEAGLFGQWSIGIGGHVSQEDLYDVKLHTDEDYPPLATLVYAGAIRELQEELGIDPREFGALGSIDDFTYRANRIIQSYTNATSCRHVGIPLLLKLAQAGYKESSLNLDPAEFCNFKWMSVDELKANWNEFEDWSKWLINAME